MAKRGKKLQLNIWVLTLCVLAFAAIIGYLAWTQLRAYEEGVMEIYATQQDGYVQLVLDQINLNKDRSNDEIITNILGTLDESSNKYWTLSQDDALVFVKDVMESSRYRGFSTETYFDSYSAFDFINSLQNDRVIHRSIRMGQREFVASGAQFQYRGQTLRVCLLTSADIVLDQNAYLSAKINLGLLAVIELSTLVLMAIGLAALGQKWKSAYGREKKDSEELRATIEQLNNILSQKEMYDTRLMAFQGNTLPQLLQKLEAKDAWPLSFILLSCDSTEIQDRFLSDSQVTLDRRVFRVIMDDQFILLISVKDRDLADQAALIALREPGLGVAGTFTVHSKPAASLEKTFYDFYQNRVNIYGAKAIS